MSDTKNTAEKKHLKEKLSTLQYEVTQEDGTEPPFNNEYWDNKREGIYVDIVSGEPLFSSHDKYDSGTGWPSFFKPLEPNNLVLKEDRKLFGARTEVRSKSADSHLGHVFDDGPAPTHKRYCMNSAAMKFIPKENLLASGYGQYVHLFEERQPATGVIREAKAYVAGGCFWCMEADFLKLRGIKNVESGYMGGDEKNPSYEQVSAGKTGHAEAIRITFDPSVISFEDVLQFFWLNIDPTVKDRQFCDVGAQYRSAIFYADDAQKAAAEKSLDAVKRQFPKLSFVTEIAPAKEFYRAEEYHQRYFEKNPIRYQFYRFSCGRDKRLSELWGKERDKLLDRLKK